MIYRRSIRLGGPLTGVSIAPSAKPDSAASNDVLAFAAPPLAEPKEPAQDPAKVLALRATLAELGRVIDPLRTLEQATVESVAQATVELAVALAERS